MTHRRSQQPRPSHLSGFALVLALMLMAFVLLLLLSITTLVRVETRAANINLEQLRARESARLALMLAIGELQKHTGADQRVTARADILGEGNYATAAKFWTGVWDTTDPSAEPVWLVSGANADPANLPADQMQLVGMGSAGTDTTQYVYAPALDVLDTAGNVSEEIAWWISDEGVKASVGLSDHINELADQFFNDYSSTGLSVSEQRQILKQIGPRRVQAKVFYGADINLAPNKADDIRDESVTSLVEQSNETLNRILNDNQLPLLNGITPSEHLNAFHSITYQSLGVISDTERGGLKIDLSDQGYRNSTGFPKVNDALQQFLWDSSPNVSGEIEITGLTEADYKTLQDGDPVTTTPVIITECALYFVVSGQSKNSKNARAFLRLEAEMWSPYGLRHAFTGATGSNTPELKVEFTGLPNVQLKFYDQDSAAFTNSTSLSFDQISPEFEFDFTETHKSGEIRKMTATWPINSSADKRNFYYTKDWVWVVDDPSYNEDHRAISYPDGDYIHYTSAPAKITLTVRNMDNEILQKIENIPIAEIDTNFSYYESSPSSLSVSDAPIVFHYRLYDSVTDLEKWFTELDPRAASLDLDHSDVFDAININDVDGDNQGDADLPTLAFSNLDFFHGQANNNFFRIYDLPSTIPYSLGALQHIQIKGKPPYSIGNRWGGDQNEAFDRYFISSIPQNTTTNHWQHDTTSDTKPSLPNPFISVTERGQKSSSSNLQNYKSARYLLQQGSFNFNSTAPLAWQAILSGNSIFDWNYTWNKGTSTEGSAHRLNLESSYFRLPFSGHLKSKSFTQWEFPFESYEDESSPTDDYPILTNEERELIFKAGNGINPGSEWKPSTSLGLRELSMPDIQQLAQNITDKLKQRGRPFDSFKALVNSGLIQDAIDETSINSIIADTNYQDVGSDLRIPRNATSFLSQADILSALSPCLSARSDTFKIRAGASRINLITNQPDGAIYCEAIIQRLPERWDSISTNEMDNALGFGRKIKILSIRWLDTSQL